MVKHKFHAWTASHDKGRDKEGQTPIAARGTCRVYREMTSHTLEVRKTAMRGNTVFYIQQQSHLESVVITGIYSGAGIEDTYQVQPYICHHNLIFLILRERVEKEMKSSCSFTTLVDSTWMKSKQKVSN